MFTLQECGDLEVAWEVGPEAEEVDTAASGPDHSSNHSNNSHHQENWTTKLLQEALRYEQQWKIEICIICNWYKKINPSH